MLRRPTVFLADAQSLLSELVAQSIGDHFEIAGSARDGQSAVKLVQRLKPDVVILDVFLPMLNGLDAALRIRQASPATRIVFLAMTYDRGMVRRALTSGALGFLLKTSAASELPTAIWAVLHGNRHVTPSLVELFEESGYDDEEASRMTARERE